MHAQETFRSLLLCDVGAVLAEKFHFINRGQFVMCLDAIYLVSEVTYCSIANFAVLWEENPALLTLPGGF
jgi:hypothetical protein